MFTVRLSIPSCLSFLLVLRSHVYILLLFDSFYMKKEERTMGVPNPRFLSSLSNYSKAKSITFMLIESKRTLGLCWIPETAVDKG